jgi:hypothetical protein
MPIMNSRYGPMHMRRYSSAVMNSSARPSVSRKGTNSGIGMRARAFAALIVKVASIISAS